MEEPKINKKKKLFHLILAGITAIVFVLICNHITNKSKIELTKVDNIQTNEERTATKTTAKAPDKPAEVFSLGEIPFKNDEFATFQTTSIDQLLKLEQHNSAIIIVNKDFLNEENKKEFMGLVKKHHTIIFYDENITAEEVVLFFDGIVPVIPIESSIPLKFQAYGITTLNDELIPVFVSATTDQTELNEETFKQLFKQLVEKNK